LANESAKEDWTPPRAELLGSRPTIVIRPAKGANYRPCDWRLELDQDQIFNRLIFGVHADRFAFIRELIQNALDATRCQMFDAHPGVATKNPANAPEDIRNRFPLTIALKAITIRNEAAQQDELRQVLAIEDRGTGMDEDIVRRYFLQIGRSYYQSGEFKQRYAFSPAGRFGIGFLSTLAASDHVRVETFRPSSPRGSEPLALTLTGPRNYIALEQGSRRVAGTRIEVRLLPDCELEPGVLTKKVRGWCRRVEFPIEVDDLGSKSVIVQERAADFVFQVPHPEHPDATLVLRAFDVDEAGIQGELYVLAKRLANGAEDWTETRDYKYEYPKVHPEATLPPLPRSLDCLHGIASFREPREAMIARLDVRRSNVEFDLSRSQAEPHTRERSELAIRKLWQEVLEEHLAHTPFAQGPAAWRYLNKLADDFPLGSPFWDSKTMIPLRRTGAEYLVSREQLNGITVLTEFSQVQRGAGEKDESGFDKIAIGVNPVDFRRLSDGHQESLFLSREPSNCRWVSRSHLAVDWTLRSQTSKSQMMTLTKHGLNEHFMCDLPRPDTVAFHIHRPLRAPGCILVNGRNALGRWYRSVVELTGKASWATESRVHALIGVLDRAATSRHSYIDELRRHLAGWESVKDLPGNLKPPLQMLTPESFDLRLVDGDI
jgi:molecular chaperone HtpG